jgi:hypothetical protein
MSTASGSSGGPHSLIKATYEGLRRDGVVFRDTTTGMYIYVHTLYIYIYVCVCVCIPLYIYIQYSHTIYSYIQLRSLQLHILTVIRYPYIYIYSYINKFSQRYTVHSYKVYTCFTVTRNTVFQIQSHDTLC